MTTLERRLTGSDLRISGTVRITTADTLAASLLPGILAEFRTVHPGIEVDVAVSNVFHGRARELYEESGATVAHISIAHTTEHAIAEVILEKE